MKLRNAIKAILVGSAVAAVPMAASAASATSYGLSFGNTVGSPGTTMTQLGNAITDAGFIQRSVETTGGIFFQTIISSNDGTTTYKDENYVGFEVGTLANAGIALRSTMNANDNSFKSHANLNTGNFMAMTLNHVDVGQTITTTDFSADMSFVEAMGGTTTLTLNQGIVIANEVNTTNPSGTATFQLIDTTATGSGTVTLGIGTVSFLTGDTVGRLSVAQTIPGDGGFALREIVNDSNTAAGETKAHDEFGNTLGSMTPSYTTGINPF